MNKPRIPSCSTDLRVQFRYPAWQSEVHAALIEMDPARLTEKILKAEATIAQRRTQLVQDGATEAANDELLAIADALASVTVLRRELHDKVS